MRDILSEKNIVEVADGRTGDIHEIEYRSPTAADVAAYRAACFMRKGKKIVNNQFQARLRWGARILTGFKKGTLCADGRPISANPSDADYREDWKKLLAVHAPDIVEAVAVIAFDGTGRPGDVEFETFGQEEEDDEEAGEDSDLDPFRKKTST